MYQTKKTFVKPGMKMAELIFENPSLLMLLEHFRFDLVVHNHTVEQISLQHNVNPGLFVTLCNLYNGFPSSGTGGLSKEDIPAIIFVLRNTHYYYTNDKYPEIKDYIDRMSRKNSAAEMKMVELFFNNYFNEVVEHLNYEEEVVFPAICKKLGFENPTTFKSAGNYSMSVYRDHHTDIESKLSELKNLLLKHIPLNDDRVERRKLLVSLFELESDLNLHSLIEESILIPLVKKYEAEGQRGK
jgi:regulator of cell morphogenesis and NO signaling